MGVASYQTAWAWLHKLRRAMAIPGRELLAGAVEVDESYFGACRPGAAGRAVSGKPIAAIGVEDRGEASGRVHMRRIPDVSNADRLRARPHPPGLRVRTDGWQGYFDVGRHPFMHVVTNPSASGDPHVAMPHISGGASLVQRWLLGAHQGAIGPPPARLQHLPNLQSCVFTQCVRPCVAPRRAEASTKQAGRLLACRRSSARAELDDTG